ncbi:DUF3967 domain-containing protein [Bacillus infantis]|uniref:DUF3967 domain-containing protein n=1 Tax=Bacillus infantis TaxID=324767 RepID=UPI003CE9E34E
MSDDMNESAILMNPSDVCTLIGIKESTLRKYAGILKNAGYDFHVNDKGQRGYFEKDVIVLKRFLEVKENRDMTLEQAANAVISWVKQSNMSLRVIEENEEKERYNDDIKALKETVQKQNELLEELMRKMDQQQRYIDQRLEERDRNLMESLRINQETKQQLLEIATARDEDRKKGFWSKLLGR